MLKNLWPILVYSLAAVLPILIVACPEWFPEAWTSQDYSTFAYWAPFMMLSVGLIMGIKLGQTRILSSFLLFLISYLLMGSEGGSTWMTEDPRLSSNMVVVLLPLMTFVFFLIDESPWLSGRSAFRALLSFSPLYLTAIFNRFPDLQNILYYRFKFRPEVTWWSASDLGLFFLLVFVVNVATTRDRFLKDFKVALFLALLPCIFVLGSGNIGLHVLGFNFAAFILLVAALRLQWQQVYIDELTGIPNQRALEEELKRIGPKYSIGIIDLDHFKKFNESYGHETGDQALRMVAKHLDKETRSKTFRIDGNEFCMIFVNADPDGVRLLTERMCRRLAERRFFIRSNSELREQGSAKDRGDVDAVTEKVQVTISVGLVSSHRKGASPKEMLNIAEKALHQAKEQGRNRVVVADPAGSRTEYE